MQYSEWRVLTFIAHSNIVPLNSNWTSQLCYFGKSIKIRHISLINNNSATCYCFVQQVNLLAGSFCLLCGSKIVDVSLQNNKVINLCLPKKFIRLQQSDGNCCLI